MGRHGGINILHQKSWHVWRLDNRLTVERDELRHAAQEREKLEAEQRAVFEGTLARLRRRADGLEEDGAEEELRVAAPSASGTGGGSSPSRAGKTPGRRGAEAKKASTESSYKYGCVTTSNLKQAEQDLESMLKGRKQHAKRYWGSSELGTGSGPHINLFEEAELESQRHLADHQKQVQYTARNNELAQKSKKALFSEFDEISQNQPWYARSPQHAGAASAAACSPSTAGSSTERTLAATERSRSRSRPGRELRRRWGEKHGQQVLHVSAKGRRSGAATQDAAAPATAPAAALVESSEDDDRGSRKGRRRLEKEDRRRSKKAAKEEELRALRAERDRREREERARAAALLSGPARTGY